MHDIWHIIVKMTCNDLPLTFTRGYITATRAMVEAMRTSEVRRLILCHSWYTEAASRSQAMFLIR